MWSESSLLSPVQFAAFAWTSWWYYPLPLGDFQHIFLTVLLIVLWIDQSNRHIICILRICSIEHSAGPVRTQEWLVCCACIQGNSSVKEMVFHAECLSSNAKILYWTCFRRQSELLRLLPGPTFERFDKNQVCLCLFCQTSSALLFLQLFPFLG